MGYWLEDANGYIGDIASVMGLRDLRLHGPPALRRFVAHGRCDSESALRRIIAECESVEDEHVREVVQLLSKAKVPILTDGS